MEYLFKTAEKLYGELSFTGYRAQVVTYAIARLSHAVQSRLPYDEIWESQSVPEELRNALKLLLTGIREEIVDRRPANTNISEWCKKDQCWAAVLQREFDLGVDNRGLVVAAQMMIGDLMVLLIDGHGLRAIDIARHTGYRPADVSRGFRRRSFVLPATPLQIPPNGDCVFELIMIKYLSTT